MANIHLKKGGRKRGQVNSVFLYIYLAFKMFNRFST
jgi:hypothetical protein